MTKNRLLTSSKPFLLVLILLLAGIDSSAGWGWSSSSTDNTNEKVDAPAEEADPPISTDPPMPAEAATEERAVDKDDVHNEPAKPIQQPSDVSAAEETPHITSSTVEVTSDGDSVEISEDSNSVVKQMADEANHQEEKNEPT